MRAREFINESFKLPIEELRLPKQSVKIAMRDLMRGHYSRTKGPISVTSSDTGFILGDGVHRVLQGLLVGQTKINAKIDSRYATEFAGGNLWEPDLNSPTLGLEELGFDPETVAKVQSAFREARASVTEPTVALPDRQAREG